MSSLKATSLNRIIPDRAQGGASINPGQIELMIHRRTTQDDARGVGEALDEKGSLHFLKENH